MELGKNDTILSEGNDDDMSLSSERIVSFLPSSTEILYEIGAESQIVGVTHECKYPDSAKRKPRVINASFDANKMNSKEIDQKIIELMQSGGDIYLINDEKLREAKPDLIIAQVYVKYVLHLQKKSIVHFLYWDIGQTFLYLIHMI